MATKQFPTTTPIKLVPHDDDTLLLANSELSNEASRVKVSDLIAKAADGLNLDGKANVTDVLLKENTGEYSPTLNYHPATKLYVDSGDASVMAYVDSEVSTKADKVNVLELDNTTPFTPSGDYHPATKSYVDSLSGSSQFVNIFTETLAGQVTRPNIKTYNHFHYDVIISSTVGNPLGGIDASMEGYTGTLILRQDSSGGNTISFGSDWLFPLGAPTINTGGDAMNIFKYTVVYNGVNYMIFAEFVASYIGDSTGGGYC